MSRNPNRILRTIDDAVRSHSLQSAAPDGRQYAYMGSIPIVAVILAYELGLVVAGAQRKPPCTDTPTPKHVRS